MHRREAPQQRHGGERQRCFTQRRRAPPVLLHCVNKVLSVHGRVGAGRVSLQKGLQDAVRGSCEQGAAARPRCLCWRRLGLLRNRKAFLCNLQVFERNCDSAPH